MKKVKIFCWAATIIFLLFAVLYFIEIRVYPASNSCLPPTIHESDVISTNQTLTVGQALEKLGSYCTTDKKLVDSDAKEIYFYRITGCWGNPPSNYQSILANQEKDIENLSKKYDVIRMTCNPSGIPIP